MVPRDGPRLCKCTLQNIPRDIVLVPHAMSMDLHQVLHNVVCMRCGSVHGSGSMSAMHTAGLHLGMLWMWIMTCLWTFWMVRVGDADKVSGALRAMFGTTDDGGLECCSQRCGCQVLLSGCDDSGGAEWIVVSSGASCAGDLMAYPIFASIMFGVVMLPPGNVICPEVPSQL